jgi:hypothetical protein
MKERVYGDATLWVKLWQANKGSITNPDVIRPGQRLHIPAKAPLTSRERAAMAAYYQERSSSEQRSYAQSQK